MYSLLRKKNTVHLTVKTRARYKKVPNPVRPLNISYLYYTNDSERRGGFELAMLTQLNIQIS